MRRIVGIRSPVTFAIEPMRLLLPEIKPLHVAHWQELKQLRPAGELEPDYDLFVAYESVNAAFVATARRDGRLIGYCSFYLSRDLWTSQRFATGDLVYVTPSQRGRWIAVRLFQYALDYLKHRGITDVRDWVEDQNPVAKLLRYAGYKPTGKREYARTL